MQICSVSVEGFRCLADVAEVPVLSQTVLTGQNEGGKTALLDALNFLLHGTVLSENDLTYVGDGELQESAEDAAAPHARVPQTVVTGSFSLSADEQIRLKLPEQVRVRRRYRPEAGMFLEIHRRVCQDPQLRDLAEVKLPRLKELAAAHGIDPVGQANARASWEQPLGALAQQMKQVDAWVLAHSEVAAALPTMVYFKGDSVQAPEAVIQSLLNSRLREYTRADEVSKRVSDLEDYLAESLKEDIDSIRRHIAQRCTLPSVELAPQVQVRPALVGVELNVMDSHGRRFPLSSAGTGRSRRISLALWESSNELLGQHDVTQAPESDVLFVYDEPDTHLDYAHQRRIMALLQLQASRPNARVIVATHSLNLIDGVDISSVVHLRTQEGRVRAEVLNDDSADEDVRRHLSTIATTLGFRNSVLLHERFFVAVEGVSETSAFPILFRKHASFPIQSAGICLWAGGSNEGALRFARFLKDHGRDVAFVVDKDSRTNQRRAFRDDKLKEHGFDLEKECFYLGAPNELEDLFTDDDWAETANALWKPNPERGPWQPQEIVELRAGKFSSQLLALLKGGSPEGPQNKEDLMVGIAAHLAADRIPAALSTIFDSLVSRAQNAGPHLW
ncbi:MULTISPECIES: AAA family ATPase [unclassified Streptomyces]|uniref:AAA family ATPase n=1 Tax=unclassified Streptomyces TaxID=2593676 RepID=UPI00225523CF|nr:MULTISPECIES: AAA family ATPase [unclassified Streptomyces]MCX4834323.1 AAA family ATPase [Streptomyces sp. NBC_01016]